MKQATRSPYVLSGSRKTNGSGARTASVFPAQMFRRRLYMQHKQETTAHVERVDIDQSSKTREKADCSKTEKKGRIEIRRKKKNGRRTADRHRDVVLIVSFLFQCAQPLHRWCCCCSSCQILAIARGVLCQCCLCVVIFIWVTAKYGDTSHTPLPLHTHHHYHTHTTPHTPPCSVCQSFTNSYEDQSVRRIIVDESEY